MISRSAAKLAFRNRAIALSVITTGSAALGVTAVGYTRQTGSFITDGFVVGMEVTPSTGFTETTPGVIAEVAAQLLTIKGGRTVIQQQAAGRVLVVGLPAIRAWENLDAQDLVLAGRWYVTEQFVPATHELLGQRSGGLAKETGLYVLTVFAPENIGSLAIEALLDDLLALFTPGTSLTAGSDTVRVRADVAPFAGQIIPQGDGWSRCVLTVPWWALTTNTIAA